MAQFELFCDVAGKYRYRLRSANQEIILQDTKGDTTKEACLLNIKTVKCNAPFDEQYIRLKSKDGQFFFHLIDSKGKILGRSETYTTTAARENGIAAVKRDAPAAPIIDLTTSAEIESVVAAEATGGLSILPRKGNCHSGIPVKPNKGGYYGYSIH